MASRKRRVPGAPKRGDYSARNATGLRQGLANYGDAGFSLFLRKAFIKAGGYSDDAWIVRSSASPTPSATTTPAMATCRT